MGEKERKNAKSWDLDRGSMAFRDDGERVNRMPATLFFFRGLRGRVRRKGMGIWRKRKKEEEDKMEREDVGKMVKVQLSKKSGEPILGFTSPKGEDQAERLRTQAKDLREMAKRLERMSEEMERSASAGAGRRLLRKVFPGRVLKKVK
jgi:hypothetical protein